MNASVTVELSRDEALVLFEWLASIDTQQHRPNTNEAAQKVLWTVEGQLEKLLLEPLAPDYAERLEAARKRVLTSK